MYSNYNYLIKYVRERHNDDSIEYFIENVKYSFIDEDDYMDVVMDNELPEVFGKRYSSKKQAIEVTLDNNYEVFREINRIIKWLKKEKKINPNNYQLEKFIIYHENVLFELKQFFSIHKLRIQKQGKSSGRPKGSRNKLTIKKHNWVRDKYYILKKRISSSTRKEKAKLIRSKLLENPPDWWDKHIYSIETIMDIIKKKKWGK